MPTTNAFAPVFDRMLTLSRALDQALANDQTWPEGTRQGFWLPNVDTYETRGSFVIEADLPGVHPENVDISFEQGSLTLKGTRAPTLAVPEEGEFRVYVAERPHGAFARSIRLPEYVDGERIEANFHNGVLTINVPKAPNAVPRKITVKASGETKELSR